MASLLRKVFKKMPFTCFNKKELIVYEDEAEVVEAAAKENKILFMLQDEVYDVTTYLDAHPGGKEVLLLSKGKIVDKVYEKYHYPLGEAPKILKKYKIGILKRKLEQGQNETALST